MQHKTNSPDYMRFENKDCAVKDFQQRIAHYESRYRPLGIYPDENKYSFIQIVNAGDDWHFHHCRSAIQVALVHFLLDLYAVAAQSPQVKALGLTAAQNAAIAKTDDEWRTTAAAQ